MASANNTTKRWELMPVTIAAASAIPARSDPTFKVLASKSATAAPHDNTNLPA